MHEHRQTNNKREDVVPKGAVPAYLLDRYVKASCNNLVNLQQATYLNMCGLRDSSIESGTFPFLSLPYPSPSFSREGQSRAKVLSNMVKQKRKEKAVSDHIFELFIKSQPCCQYLIFTQGKWTVPLPKVRAVGEDEVFKVLRTGKRKSKFSIFLTNDMYFNFTFVFINQRRVGNGWSPRLHMWVRASQENHPNTKDLFDLWYVYILAF